jgi:hypothetical protein
MLQYMNWLKLPGRSETRVNTLCQPTGWNGVSNQLTLQGPAPCFKRRQQARNRGRRRIDLALRLTHPRCSHHHKKRSVNSTQSSAM